MIITIPVMTDSVNKAVAGSRLSCTAGTSATIMAMAPVPWMAMKVELVASVPVNVPTMYAYRPESGLTPASRPVAKPSGTDHGAPTEGGVADATTPPPER